MRAVLSLLLSRLQPDSTAFQTSRIESSRHRILEFRRTPAGTYWWKDCLTCWRCWESLWS